MTLITFQDGRPILKDGKIGTEQPCCCGPECRCRDHARHTEVEAPCAVEEITVTEGGVERTGQAAVWRVGVCPDGYGPTRTVDANCVYQVDQSTSGRPSGFMLFYEFVEDGGSCGDLCGPAGFNHLPDGWPDVPEEERCPAVPLRTICYESLVDGLLVARPEANNVPCSDLVPKPCDCRGDGTGGDPSPQNPWLLDIGGVNPGAVVDTNGREDCGQYHPSVLDFADECYGGLP